MGVFESRVNRFLLGTLDATAVLIARPFATMKLMSAEAYLKHVQTPGKRHEIDEILAPVLFLQNIFAHQILDPTWSLRKNALKLTGITFLLTYVILGTAHFMRTTDNFNLYSEAIFTLIIIYQFTFQVLFFVLYRSSFRKVYAMAKLTIFDVIKEVSPERCVYLISLFKNMVKVVFLLILTPTLHYLGTALWFYFDGERVTLSPSTSILMPMSSPTFEVGLFSHTVFFIMVASGTLTVTMWFVFLTCFLCEACDCAVEVLKIDKKCNNDNLYASRLNMALGEFYSVHVKLMEYLNTLNAMYSWPLLVPLLAVLMLTCVFMLVTTEDVNWHLAIVVLVESLEVTAYNMLGERIKSKAEQMKMALLRFDWRNMRVKDQKNYCIIVCYMNKDFGVRTAAGVDLSLLALSSIYKGSYQAYAVFNTMNN